MKTSFLPNIQKPNRPKDMSFQEICLINIVYTAGIQHVTAGWQFPFRTKCYFIYVQLLCGVFIFTAISILKYLFPMEKLKDCNNYKMCPFSSQWQQIGWSAQFLRGMLFYSAFEMKARLLLTFYVYVSNLWPNCSLVVSVGFSFTFVARACVIAFCPSLELIYF